MTAQHLPFDAVDPPDREGALERTLDRAFMPTLLRRNRFVLVAVSSSALPLARLCPFESSVHALSGLFGDRLRLTRLDCAEDAWSRECAQEDPAQVDFPRFVLYVDRKRFALSRSHFFAGLVLQLQKLLGEDGWVDAVLPLKAPDADAPADLDRALDPIWRTRKDRSGRLVDRTVVLGVFPETTNGSENLQRLFRQTALKLLWRTDVRFVETADPRLADRLRLRRPELFAGQPGANTLAVLKLRNRFDPDDEVSVFSRSARLPFEAWLSERLLGLVDELTWHNQDSFNNEMPLLVLFLDPAADRRRNLEYLEGFRELAKTYLHKMNFVWCDFQDNRKLMKLLGVEAFR